MLGVYDSHSGRFINRDPIAELGGNNLFVYCFNAPARYTDPLGLDVGIVVAPRDRGFPGFGHCAVLVGNDDSGWTYYSNSWGGDPNSGSTYPNLATFYDTWDEDYDPGRTSMFPGDEGDAAAAAAAQASIGTVPGK